MVDSTVLIGKSPGPGAWLYVTNGPQAGRDFRLGQRTTIGSDSTTCDAILMDKTVSANHARVQRDGKVFVLYDLASKNGTYVNGKRVQKITLNDDDEIQLGKTFLIFKVAAPK